jgi:hypothetical protein
MNQSCNNNRNYTISMIENIVVTLVELDLSGSIECETIDKNVMVQDWVNNIQNESIVNTSKDNNDIYIIDLSKIQTNLNKSILPDTEMVNKMSLQESLSYETMLLNIVDKTPSNTNLNVKILFHLKIICNNQIHKFRIFE